MDLQQQSRATKRSYWDANADVACAASKVHQFILLEEDSEEGEGYARSLKNQAAESKDGAKRR
jgi:hypothetical protein